MNIAILFFSSLLIAPFEANTITCQQRYTLAPTSEPTPNPTTYRPTPSPEEPHIATESPSISDNLGSLDEPEIELCQEFGFTDIIILNDISCTITPAQCESQQAQIADTMKSFISRPDNSNIPMVRIGYIEFDTDNADVVYSLADDYNARVTQDDIDNYRTFIAQQGHCDNILSRNSNPGDLIKALDLAMDHFDDSGSDDYGRDRKIVIFSNCPVTNTEEVCDRYEDYIRQGSGGASRGDNKGVGFGINVVMVNQGFTDEGYLLCLTEYDDERIMHNPHRESEMFYDNVLPGITNAICHSPSPAPTTDPTTDPTADPTEGYGYGYGDAYGYNEEPSSKRLIRRLYGDDNDYQVEFSGNAMLNSPCIYLELNLQTENLLPNNMAPDARTNIQIIGSALGNSTGGSIAVPDPIDIEEDEEPIDYDPNLNWTTSAECEGTPQIEDTYWPMDEMKVEGGVSDVYEVGDRFFIEVDIKTPNSIVYRFELDSLNLSITHNCADDLVMAAGLYLKDELVNETESLTIVDGDESMKTFYFENTVRLYANKLYTITFALVNAYPKGCGADNVKYNGQSLSDIMDYESDPNARRRLNEVLDYADIAAAAHPDSCTLGAAIAASDAMRTGVAAMCQANTLQTRPAIEEGQFQQHACESAIANHLLQTGSLHLFDENGTLTLNITDWPEHNVEEPCIAIDEDNLIIYAIGGHDGTGAAVDYIQGYQFDDDSMKNGHIIEHLRDYSLPDKRYGSECFYWKDERDQFNKDKIILISGMANKASELTKRSDFYRDIQMFDIPQAGAQPFAISYTVKYTKNPSGVVWNLIDAKPMLVGDDLYFFGGKTHVESKPFVSRMDLNNFVNADGIQKPAGLNLTEGKALPLIDQVFVNCTEAGQPAEIKKCYMVFAGQSYQNRKLVPVEQGGITTDYLQLFCNDAIEGSYQDIFEDDSGDDRRRLRDDERIIPAFTELDMKMLKKGKEMNRRRLVQGVELPKTDVFMRNYNYGLDGLYYNFSVFIEQCYDNNDGLSGAEEFYTNIITSKQSDDKTEWEEFKGDLEEKILNASKQAYRGWNNLGFGDVDIWNLQILNISYEVTPSPTTGCDYPHTERRKHRYYYKNYEDDTDEDNIVWIDEQFDDDDLF